MNGTLVLKIKKRTQSQWLCCFLVVLPFFFGTVIDLFHGPNAIKYVTDFAWLFLLVTLARNGDRVFSQEVNRIRYCIIALIASSLIGFVLNYQSILYYLWGFRNQIRFFLFFLSCTVFLRHNDAKDLLDLFDIIFYINFVVTLVQYFVLGRRQDYLGGIFGTAVGCNAKTIIFLSIVTSKSVLSYMNKEELLSRCVTKCCITLFVAALAELKFFFILFLLIVMMASLLTDFSMRKLMLICLAIICAYVGVRIMVTIFPMWGDWFSLDSILETALSKDGYTGRGDMNRLTSMPIVWNRFLDTFGKKVFGLGLGNCDTSAFSFLNTPFYERYGYLRYNWFSGAFTLLELGLSGAVCYVLFFALVYLYALKMEKSGNCIALYSQMARITVVVCLLLSIYNASMRTEEAYFMYFVMALPFLR